MLVDFQLVSGNTIWLNPRHIEAMNEGAPDKDGMPTTAIRMVSGQVYRILHDAERAADIIDATTGMASEVGPETLLALAAALLRGADVVAQGALGDQAGDPVTAEEALGEARELVAGAREMVENEPL
jgi:uncharacterized protein YlzI (FlbEa/FlbD family)